MKAILVPMLAVYATAKVAGLDDPPAVAIVLVAMFDLYACAVAMLALAPDEWNREGKIES